MGTPAGGWGGTGEPTAWRPVGRIDLARLGSTTKAQGALAFLLFLSLQLPWYTSSVSGVSGSASAMVAGGWRWLIWLISLATVIYLALGAVTSWHDPAWLAPRRMQVLIGLAAVDALLVLIAAFAVKAHPPSVLATPANAAVGTGIGAVLATLLALGVLGVAVLELINASPKGESSGLRGRRPAPLAEDDAPTHVAFEPGRDVGGSRAADPAGPTSVPDPLRIPSADTAQRRPAQPGAGYPPQRPPEPGSGPPTGWMPPQPPPPPPL
jgi:hypothetical protein